MPFSMPCPNRGCGKIMEPYLDQKEDKVYCSICDKEISNITHFVKSQMKSLKQFRKKDPKPFAVKCDSCGREERPKLIKDDVVCGSCSKALPNISPIFKNMLKEQLKTTDKDV